MSPETGLTVGLCVAIGPSVVMFIISAVTRRMPSMAQAFSISATSIIAGIVIALKTGN